MDRDALRDAAGGIVGLAPTGKVRLSGSLRRVRGAYLNAAAAHVHLAAVRLDEDARHRVVAVRALGLPPARHPGWRATSPLPRVGGPLRRP